MKSSKYVIIPALLLMASCGGKTEVPETEIRTTETADSTTGIISKTPYSVSDTIRVKGKLYNYSFCFEPSDTLPVITNTVGQSYKDNIVRLVITLEGEEKYNHLFTKNDFVSIVPKEFMKTSALVGFNFNYNMENDHSAFHFIATVGDPDDTAELSYPMEISIGTDWHLTMKKAENIETEPVNPGMTIDPADDEGV